MRERMDVASAQLDRAVAVVRRLLEGLTDDEYLWEPVAGCWSVRRSGEGWALEVSYPDPDPPPFTTIAWLLVHLTQATSVVAHGVRDEGVTGWPRTSGSAADAVADWERVAADLQMAMAVATDADMDRLYTLPWGRQPAPVSELIWEAAIYETTSTTAPRWAVCGASTPTATRSAAEPAPDLSAVDERLRSRRRLGPRRPGCRGRRRRSRRWRRAARG